MIKESVLMGIRIPVISHIAPVLPEVIVFKQQPTFIFVEAVGFMLAFALEGDGVLDPVVTSSP